MRFMKKNLKIFLLAVLVAVASCSFTTKSFDNPDKDRMLIDLITYVLERTHFEKKEFNDEFSASVFDKFINDVDPLKRYFLASDIEEFRRYEHQIDDQLKNKELTFFDLVYTRLEQRINEAKDIYKDVLSKPFDYTENESINVDYENIPFAKDKKELEERWKLQLKFSSISNYYDLKEEQRNRLEGNTSESEDDDDYIDEDEFTFNNKTEKKDSTKIKTDAEMEQEARESTLSSLDDYFDFIDDLEREDYFGIYINAIVEEFDPHTNYMAPQAKERFDTSMSGKLEGIGARLQKERDNVKILELISGGPAWRSEQLEVGDQIIRVRQENETESVSIVGMRLDDAVKLIKGPKGSKVTLTVKKVDGSFEDITLTRDVVELEETYAKSSLIKQEDKTFGIIHLPRFYFDMGNYKARNAASDVKEEITKLKEEGVEGLILDLRNNGGGSLRTAIDIAGLFINSGPIVQVADSYGKIAVLEDKDKNITWDGPLVILVNEVSASASEILAAAMQDYARGIVIGSPQTYGKGTVQNVADLNSYLRNSPYDMGALKVTTQKFYRINGGSTQLEGVKSDIVVPDRYMFIDIGERDYKNPLPYDKIAPAEYTMWDGYIDFETTFENSKNRVSGSEQFKLIEEHARWVKERRENNEVALNYEKYIADIEKNKEKSKQFDAISKYDTHLAFSSLPYEEALKQQDSTLAKKRDRWHKSLSRDAYVEEAVYVLQDLKMSNIRKGNAANIKD